MPKPVKRHAVPPPAPPSRDSPSPPTSRVAEILALLGARPLTRLSLAEIVRSTDLSQATVLRILDALRQHGFVTRREADKTYGLGPALISLGYAARAGFASLEVARPLLEERANRLSLEWTASAVVSDEIVVLDSSESATAEHERAVPGLRYPFAPPSGVIFVAWDTDEAIRRWLARPPIVPTVPDRKRLLAVIDSCRTRGYVVERFNEATSAANSLLAGLGDRTLPAQVREALSRAVSTLGQRDYLVSELDSSAELAVGLVAVPVFDADGHPELMLSFTVNRDRVPSTAVRLYADALLEIAHQVTAELGGHDPWARLRQSARNPASTAARASAFASAPPSEPISRRRRVAEKGKGGS